MNSSADSTNAKTGSRLLKIRWLKRESFLLESVRTSDGSEACSTSDKPEVLRAIRQNTLAICKLLEGHQ